MKNIAHLNVENKTLFFAFDLTDTKYFHIPFHSIPPTTSHLTLSILRINLYAMKDACIRQSVQCSLLCIPLLVTNLICNEY